MYVFSKAAGAAGIWFFAGLLLAIVVHPGFGAVCGFFGVLRLIMGD